jgi:hypothetical protein
MVMATITQSGNVSTESLKSKASEAASSMADKAKQAASDAGHRVEDATHAVGSGMKSVAETIRDKGPREGVAGAATSSVAGYLESGGNYLEQQGVKGMAEDVTNLVRRNPMAALLCGLGLGFILARVTARR